MFGQINGSVYLLVTDIGFRDQPSIVWERLDEVQPPSVALDLDDGTFSLWVASSRRHRVFLCSPIGPCAVYVLSD